ncbi:hypothetical protein [Arthrobacter sp. SW1]|uniref:hypothetical protein n=1 Tax=Arthrobacter sp. SW1 TaxID=1920889 RepID=UPI0011131C1B|nr:hypothetical protein [Arthrobacter sp. SW1]
MKAWAIRTVIAFVFNAITLWAMAILPGVRVGDGFLWVALAFTAANLLLRALAAAVFRNLDGEAAPRRYTSRPKAARLALAAGAGVALSVGALWLTTSLAGGLALSWPVGWVFATIVVWLASIIFETVDDGLEHKAQQLLAGPDAGTRLPG